MKKKTLLFLMLSVMGLQDKAIANHTESDEDAFQQEHRMSTAAAFARKGSSPFSLPEDEEGELASSAIVAAASPKFVCGLSICGGGIRGIIPAEAMAFVSNQLGMPIHKIFNLIGGTSTGGILSLAATTPNPKNTGEAKFGADEFVPIYTTRGKDLFGRSFCHKLQTGGGWWGPKYPTDGFSNATAEYFGDNLFSQSLTETIVTTSDINDSTAKTFTSAAAHLPGKNFYSRDLARATGSAPTFFPPHPFSSRDGTVKILGADGGVFNNNPALNVAMALRERYPHAEEYYVLSLGTGEKDLSYADLSGAGKLGWISPLLDMMFDGSEDATLARLQMATHFRGGGKRFNFDQVQPKIQAKHGEMDNIDPENLRALSQYTLDMTTSKDDNPLLTSVKHLKDKLGISEEPRN